MSRRTSILAIAGVAFAFGALASQWMPRGVAQVKDVKGPKWQYGLSTKVRPADVAEFGKDAKKFGIEVFRDDNSGNLIYISETGSIAVVPVR